MRLVFVGLALVSLAPLGAARAADLSPLQPSPSLETPLPAASWQGLYAGSVYGGGFGQFRSRQAASNSVSKFGETTGALIGYNFESSRFVYGVEGDITLDAVSAKNPGVAPGLVSSGIDTLYTSRLRARVGYDFGQFLPFVAGGVAFNESYQYNTPLGQFGQTRRETGLTLGLGVDWRVTAPFLGPIILRGEYVHDAYPEQTFGLNGGPVRTQIATNFLRLALIVQPGADWRPSQSNVRSADWAGAYAGVLGGGLRAQPRTTLGGISTSYTASGPEFGLFTGRNFMFGSWMLGFEGATMLTNATGRGPQPLAPSTSYRNYVEGDLRGRAGYAFGRFLPYIAVGAGLGQSEQIDLATGSERGSVPSASLSLGAGLEYMLNEQWSARAEYLYDASVRNADTRLDGLAYSQSRRAQMIRLGVAYHFH